MRTKGILGLCLAVLLGPAPLRSQDAGLEALFEFMYAKFAASFATGRGKDATSEFLVLANPGMPLAAESLRNPMDLWDVVDLVPRPTRVYQPSGERVSAVYRRLLATADLVGTQDQGLRARAQDAGRVLYDRYRPGKITPEYSRYLDCEAACAAAQDALTSAKAQSQAAGSTLAPDKLRALEEALSAARQDWEQKGSRTRIAGSLGTLQKLYDQNAKVFFLNLAELLDKAELEDSYPVDFHPAPDQWLGNTGWHPWVFQASDLAQPAPREAVPLGLEPGPGARPAPAWTRTLVLQVELKRVKVDRPWLNPGVFTNRAWRLGSGAGFPVVSNGNLADPRPGPLPLVVTGLLLARNLNLRWSGENGPAGGRPPGQVGPFSLAGPGKTGRVARIETSTAGASVSAPDPQIIGYFCLVVPRCPDPDPKLFK